MYVCSIGCLVIVSCVWISSVGGITSTYNDTDEKGKRHNTPEACFLARQFYGIVLNTIEFSPCSTLVKIVERSNALNK